tara:strand:+ start:108 stop:323 length:216 start_codon:yes stop_codon:yes gene_type:complete
MKSGLTMSILTSKTLACALLLILSIHQFGPLKDFGNTPLRDSFGLPFGATPVQLVGVAGVVVGGMCLFKSE